MTEYKVEYQCQSKYGNPLITSVEAGQMFQYKDSGDVCTVIRIPVHMEHKYIFGGVSGNPSSCYNAPLRTHDEFVQHLNLYEYSRV